MLISTCWWRRRRPGRPYPCPPSRPGSQGLIVAARSVFFTLVLLLLITYVFSIAMSQLSENTRLEDKYFPTMPQAVLTLIATWRANSHDCAPKVPIGIDMCTLCYVEVVLILKNWHFVTLFTSAIM